MNEIKSSSQTETVQGIKQQLIWLAGLLTAFSIAFLIASWRMHSLIARVAAGLVLVDLAIAVSTLMAYRFALQNFPMTNRTSRFIRLELLVTFVSSLILIGYGVRVAVDIPERFKEPVTIKADAVFILTGIFLVINVVSGWMMKKILNRGRFYLRLIPVIVMALAGFLILKSSWKSWDPVIAIIMTVIYVAAIWEVFKSVADLLQQGIPTGIKLSKVIQGLKKQGDIHSIDKAKLCWHDEGLQFVAEITLNTPYKPEQKEALRSYLKETFGIQQSILEMDYKTYEEMKTSNT
ncbi:MAG: hypothetical protein PHE86_02180 [Candidatus Marinimicrobia bacterium]|nr:hypothetical protein [Candidatus Neomarinimicrobiota bacterium]MDD5583013.1 hypothetical protein [Candidatus Neomarinimicrobiota bacterium]